MLLFLGHVLLAACDSGGGGSGIAPNAAYQQLCDPALGQSACQPSYQSQMMGRVMPLICFTHGMGQSLCTYQCTPNVPNQCDLPSPKCSGKSVCADPGEHGQNNPNGGI